MDSTNNTSFIKYLRKQSSMDLIVISSDEEDNRDGQESKDQPQETKRRKTEHFADPITVQDSDEEKTDQASLESYSLKCEDILKQQRLSFFAALDQVSQAYSINNQLSPLTMSDVESNESIKLEEINIPEEALVVQLDENNLWTETEKIEMSDNETDVKIDTANVLPKNTVIYKDTKEPSCSYHIPSIPDLESKINIPESVRINTLAQPTIEEQACMIPNDLTTEELLNMLEIYTSALNDDLLITNETDALPSSSVSRPRTRRQESNKETSKSPFFSSKVKLRKPYTPNKVWFNSNWEDWAQLAPGDILHVPFSKYETRFIEYHVTKQLEKTNKCTEDFWTYISSLLPGRDQYECKWFWCDHKGNLDTVCTNAVMIRHNKRPGKSSNKSTLLQHRLLNGRMVRHAMKQLVWKNMKRESTINGGSGDAITVAVFQDKVHGVRVAAGSLCDENVQYNMPGNLRLWDSVTEKTLTLFGHQTENAQTQQTLWRTVADVKASRDGSLFFSGSHDGTTKVWKQSTGRLISTLQFHSKPVNQLAVNYSTQSNILASCSNDGTATIWNIGVSGKSGDGSICELDAPCFQNPAVECLEFGHQDSKNLLFLGVYNRDIEHPGCIQAFDAETCKGVILFDSMNGGVSALDISSTGRLIASGNYNRYDNLSGDKHLHLHDIRERKAIQKYHTNHNDVNVVSISPCERFVASGNADKEKGEVVIFDIRSPTKCLHRLIHDQSALNQALIAPDSSIGIGGLHWMANSRMVVTGGGDSTVKVWNVEGKTRLEKTYPTTNGVTSLFVHEESMTMTAGVAGAEGIVHVWQP